MAMVAACLAGLIVSSGLPARGEVVARLDTVLDGKTWSVDAPKDCAGELSRDDGSALLLHNDRFWSFKYRFPRVTYGFAERNREVALRVPCDIDTPSPVFCVDVRNIAKTDHMLFLRTADKDGTIWSSRPFALNWTDDWRTLRIPACEMRRESAKGAESPGPRLSRVSIVVQQAMSSRLSSSGFYRGGEINIRNISVEAGDGASNIRPMTFHGKVFGKPRQSAGELVKQSVPLVSLEKGASKNYPIKTGVPLPEGLIFDESHMQLIGDGLPVPFQAKQLAWWPDGSVKSILIEFAADLSGSVKYSMDLGGDTTRTPVTLPPLCLEDSEGVTVDAGALSARFGRGEGSLIETMSIAGPKGPTPALSKEGLSSTLTDKDATAFPVSCKSIVIERNGPLSAVVKVSGVFAIDGKKSGYSFAARFQFFRDVKAVRCVFTFVNESGRADNPMPDIVLRGGWGGPMTRCQLGTDEARPLEFKDGDVEMFQDGAVYKDAKVAYPFTMRRGGGARTVAGEKFDGFAAAEGSGPAGALGLFECWQNNPKKLTISGDAFKIHLSSAESVRNGTPNCNFYHGMAKTHTMMLSFDAQEIVKDFLREPVFMTPPAWSCATGVFGKMDTAEASKYPFFEREADEWIRSFCVTPKVFGNQYGLRDFGDWYGDNPDVWMNLETSVAMALIRQYVRTGRKECLSLARQAVSHYIDIDTCHAGGEGKDGRKELGAVYAHTYQHVGIEGTKDRKLSYLGVGGHDWYPEVVYMHLLTGDEWVRDCAILHAECTVYNIQKFFREDHVLAREYAYPLKNLCAFYEISKNPEYLQAAAKIMNFFSHWRDAFATDRLGNSLYQPGICLNGIRDYYKTTRDPAAKELFIEAGRRMVDNIQFLPGEKVPVECSYNQDGRMALLNVLPDLCELTGEERYIRDFVDYPYFYLQNGLSDPSLFWCAQSFLRSMRELEIAEPFSKAYLPILSGLAQKVAGSSSGEALVEEKQDAEFTVYVSRVAAFRLDRVSRGLIDGDWEGYPDTDKKMKTKDDRLAAPHFGHVRIIAPDGTPVVDEKLKDFYSKTYTYTVPKDGKTGTYRILIEMSDALYHEMLVDSSLPTITMVNKNGMPGINPVFFRAPDEKEFTVKVQARKQGRYGGAVLYSPDGKKAGEAYWNPAGADKEYQLKGKGGGIWKVERSMFSGVSRLSIDGVQNALGATREACAD